MRRPLPETLTSWKTLIQCALKFWSYWCSLQRILSRGNVSCSSHVNTIVCRGEFWPKNKLVHVFWYSRELNSQTSRPTGRVKFELLHWSFIPQGRQTLSFWSYAVSFLPPRSDMAGSTWTWLIPSKIPNGLFLVPLLIWLSISFISIPVLNFVGHQGNECWC